MATIAEIICPTDFTDVGGFSAPITARFPVPSLSWGFCIDLGLEFPLVHVGSPYYIMNAVAPEGDYLEPTTGQIWPRIG